MYVPIYVSEYVCVRVGKYTYIAFATYACAYIYICTHNTDMYYLATQFLIVLQLAYQMM